MNPKLVAAYRILDSVPQDSLPRITEAKIPKMSEVEAVMTVARYHAQQIVKSTTAPYDGAKSIVWEACHTVDHVPTELMIFVGLESEYADFTDETRTEYYGEEHCRDVRKNVEKRIVEAAKQLISEDG